MQNCNSQNMKNQGQSIHHDTLSKSGAKHRPVSGKPKHGPSGSNTAPPADPGYNKSASATTPTTEHTY